MAFPACAMVSRHEHPHHRLYPLRSCCLQRRQQKVRAVQIARLTRRQTQACRMAQRIDRGVDFRASSACTASDGLVCACFFFRARAVLVRTHNRAVHHRVCVIRCGSQPLENCFPNAFVRPPAQSRVHRLPKPTSLRQISPRHTCAVTIQHRLDKQPMVFGRHAHGLCSSGQKTCNACPLVVSHSITSCHRAAPPSSRLSMHHIRLAL